MKYAITFTIDYNDWNATNTLFVETPYSRDEGLCISDEKWGEIVHKAMLDYGYREEDADMVRAEKMYYIRNCEDTDFALIERK